MLLYETLRERLAAGYHRDTENTEGEEIERIICFSFGIFFI
jgi:hypothetical protein